MVACFKCWELNLMMSNKNTFYKILAVISIGVFVGFLQPAATYAEDTYADEVYLEVFDTYLTNERMDQTIPALSLLVFNEAGIVHEAHFGHAALADSNTQKDTDLTANHLFLMASVSKLITAAALMQLYEQGEFALDDDIENYLPFNIDNPHHNTPISFKMLLTHTSAIADGAALDDQYYYGQDSPVKLDYFLENYLNEMGEFYDADDNFYTHKPGQIFEYSNEASALIAVLVEQISGLDFISYCRKYIFNPLGMNDSFWRLENIVNRKMIVTPYEEDAGDNKALEHYTFTDYPNGGLRSNARDMQKFLAMLMNKNTQILKPATIDTMLKSQIPNIDDSVGLHIFKMGDDTKMWGHEGGESGVSTVVGLNPQTKVGVIILTNKSDADLEDILSEAYFTIGLKQ